MFFEFADDFNKILLVKIDGPVWYTVYHHYLNQPMGKGQLWMTYPLVIEHNNGELLFFIGKTHYFYDQF